MAADYSNIYDVKKFAMENILPNFFDTEEANTFNIGLLGYLNEMIGNITEDTFNSMSFYMQEMSPVTAKLKSSIYSVLAKFRYEDVFAVPTETHLALFIKESDITDNAEKTTDSLTNETTYTFILDRNMVVDVDDHSYMMDYDLRIVARLYKGDFIYQAKYDKSFSNTISNINSPYTTCKRVNIGGTNYLMVSVVAHQVTKEIYEDALISNDVLNLPTIKFEYTGNLCGFNIFYTDVETGIEQQLTPILYKYSPLSTPFCFYKMSDEGEVTISFTSKDEYFRPSFGSDIRIEYYTCEGKVTNFDSYNGIDINVKPSSEIYDYNNGLVMIGVVVSSGINGADMPSIDELRIKANVLETTADSIGTESDITQLFSSFVNSYGDVLKFAKYRDDALFRTFMAFALLKNGNGDIYETNTLNIILRAYNNDFDVEYEQSNRMIIKPGRIFSFEQDSTKDISSLKHLTVSDEELDDYGDRMLYTNPFLISVCKQPQSVSYYINTIDKQIMMDYKYANETCFTQFNCNKLIVSRDAIGGDTSYKVYVNISLTSSMSVISSIDSIDNLDEDYTVDDTETNVENTEINNDFEDITEENIEEKVKLLLFIYGEDTRTAYKEMTFVSYDASIDMYTFECELETDDYISSNNLLRLTNVKNYSALQEMPTLVAMNNTQLELGIFYNSPSAVSHEFSMIPEVSSMTLTNTYITDTQRCDFIKPINLINSTLLYKEEDSVVTNTEDVKLIKEPEFTASTIEEGKIDLTWVLNNPYDYVKSSFFLVLNDNIDDTIELDETNLIITDGICKYTIEDLPIDEATAIQIGQTITTDIDGNFDEFEYACACDATKGIDKIGEICTECGEEVKQFSIAQDFEYSCNCGSIQTAKNIGITCGCGSKCRRHYQLVTDRYSCNCGKLRGELYAEQICYNCKSKVEISSDTIHEYTCECGNLHTYEELGKTCSVCGTICTRKRKDLSNNTEAKKLSRIVTLTASGNGDSVMSSNGIEAVQIYDDTLTCVTSKEVNSYAVHLKLVPVVSAGTFRDNGYISFINNIIDLSDKLDVIKEKTHNNFGIILRFYNTYGYSSNFTVDNGDPLGLVNLSISYAIKVSYGVVIDSLFNDIKIFIKEQIENSNTNGSNSTFLSNLTTAIENKFTDIEYCKFLGFNTFNPEIQIIEDNTISDISSLDKNERMTYIPEFLTVKLDDITLVEL